jgi:hypothetical protein
MRVSVQLHLWVVARGGEVLSAQGLVERLAQFVDQRLGAVLSASSSDIGLMAANLCFALIKS